MYGKSKALINYSYLKLVSLSSNTGHDCFYKGQRLTTTMIVCTYRKVTKMSKLCTFLMRKPKLWPASAKLFFLGRVFTKSTLQ